MVGLSPRNLETSREGKKKSDYSCIGCTGSDNEGKERELSVTCSVTENGSALLNCADHIARIWEQGY